MRKSLVVVILGLGVVAASALPRYSSRLSAAPAQSTAVFDADGKLKRPEGYRRGVFVGAPLTPSSPIPPLRESSGMTQPN